MKCKNHPDQEAMAVCQKFNYAYCELCCEEGSIGEDEAGCFCTSPNVHCKFRDQCVVYRLSREKSKERKKQD
jgi:hypothetical protein